MLRGRLENSLDRLRQSACMCIFFFFSSRRRHTRFDCDWSSDVCSSDLTGLHARGALRSETLWLPRSARPTGGVSVTTQGLFSARCLYFRRTGHTVRAEWPRKANIGYWREVVNKAELIDALAARLGDKKSAASALDAVLAEIQTAVTKGDKVAITGFGVFEKRARAARMARNPRTGEPVKVKKGFVPAFRPGAGFKDQVASGKVAKVAAAKKTTTAPAKKATTAKATTAKAAPAKTTA